MTQFGLLSKLDILQTIPSVIISKINPEILTLEIACPLFVPIIEEGLENTDIAYEIVKLCYEMKNDAMKMEE